VPSIGKIHAQFVGNRAGVGPKGYPVIDLDGYLLFIGASILLVIVPGPDMAYMLGRTIAQGRKAGVLAAIGFNLGGYVHMIASVAGLSAILAASTVAFTAIKMLGACFLVWIGLQAVFASSGSLKPGDGKDKKRQALTILWQAFLSDVLNPKVALFFLAFLPQFVAVESPNKTRQLLILGVTLNVIAITFNVTLVYFAGMATTRLRENGKLALWLNRVMGATFIVLGIRLAFEKLTLR
jgi:threonine/homoserine/homoserine lactone efflux protein